MRNGIWLLLLLFYACFSGATENLDAQNKEDLTQASAQDIQATSDLAMQSGNCYQMALPDIQEYLRLDLSEDKQILKGQGYRIYTKYGLRAEVRIEGKAQNDSTYEVQCTSILLKEGESRKQHNTTETWLRRANDTWYVANRDLGDDIKGHATWYRVNCHGEKDPKRYDAIFAFTEGFAVVERGGLQGLINEKFEEVFPIIYRNVSAVSEGTISFQDTSNQGYGVWSVKEKRMILEAKFNLTHPQNEGLIAFLDPNTGLWGFANAQGEQAIKPQFVSLNIFDGIQDMHPFNEGLANVVPQGSPDFGYIDRQGKFVIAPRFGQADGFKNGQARVYDNDAQTWYYINRQGKCVKDCP